MIEDRIRIQYPVNKLVPDRRGDKAIVTLDYVFVSGFGDKPAVFLDRTNVVGYENGHEQLDAIASDAVDFDTCFRLYNALRRWNYQISDDANAVGLNHVTVRRFILYAENVISSANYYIEREVDDIQSRNNDIISAYIKNHSETWGSIATNQGNYDSNLQALEIEENIREELNLIIDQLHQYPSDSVKKPYHLYDKLAVLIDNHYKNKRNLLRVFNKLPNFNMPSTDLFVCMALNDAQVRDIITPGKQDFVGFCENVINEYLSAGINNNDISAIEEMKRMLDNPNNSSWERRYAWNCSIKSSKGKGCVGFMISENEKCFSFSGYKDINDVSLRDRIPKSGYALCNLIDSIERAIGDYDFKAEKTNIDEEYYDTGSKVFRRLEDQLPLNDDTIEWYRCCEKKIFSHMHERLVREGNIDVIVITTLPVCSDRGCQDLIRKYRGMGNTIHTFEVSNTDTGEIKVDAF